MLFIICALFLLQPPSVLPCQQALTVNSLDMVIENYTMTSDTMVQALNRMARDFRVPMGIEWVQDAATTHPVQQSWRHTKVYDVIQSLVSAYPGYECQVVDGVVHVYDRELLNDPSNPLNLRVSSFEAEKEWVALASLRLRNMLQPLVHHRDPPPPGSGEAGSFLAGMGGERYVTVKLKNASVREVLNKLVLSAGETNWVVTYPDKRTLTSKGFRQTAALFSTAPIPEDQQPVWTLYPWELVLHRNGK